ncbi:antirestriction protein ArdA [Nocardioides sp. LHD-245]|uniref:antirestriction protein ArdA n=1 Tax=Nocardioides sp. LHD-245 TaxID=3051387 RepID=UPI0027E077C4|nr:antirestriction protein ArdA [Nocardioides sp. LHD-245]
MTHERHATTTPSSPEAASREHAAVYDAWARLNDHNPHALALFDRAYCGHYDSVAAWAGDVVASTELGEVLAQQIPHWIAKHLFLDYQGLAREWTDNREVHIEPDPAGGVWVFDLRARLL